jgi:hypothetical protein
MGGIVAFFETKTELDRLLDKPLPDGLLATDLTLVALTPEADYAAECRGVAYWTIEDLYDEMALMETGAMTFADTARLCDCLDRRLGVVWSTGKPPAFSAAYYFFTLKMIVDAAFHAGFALAHALRSCGAKSVLAFESEEPKGHERVAWMGRFLSPALPAVCRSLGLPFISLGLSAPSVGRERAALPPHHQAGLTERITAGVVRRARRLVARRAPPTRRLATDYRWCPDTIARLEAAGVEVIVYPQAELVSAGADDIAPVLDAEEVQVFFRFEGCDLFPFVRYRLRHLLAVMRPAHLVLEADFAARLWRDRVDAVAMYSPVTVPRVALAIAARRLGLPVIVNQHGGGNGYLDFPMLHYSDVYLADAFFAWGEGVVDTLLHPSLQLQCGHVRTSAEPLAIGSAALERLRRRARVRPRAPRTQRSRPTVLFISTNLQGPHRYFSWHLYAEIWYWRAQRRILETLARKNVHIIYKIPPFDNIGNPIGEWIEASGLDSVELCLTPLSEVLAEGDFDLIVTDYGATALVEAAATDRPIVFLCDRSPYRLRDEAAPILERRMAVASSVDDFCAAVDTAIDGLIGAEPATPSPVDDAFFEAYGITHQGDGAADRFVDAFFRLLAAAGRAPAPTSQIAESAS